MLKNMKIKAQREKVSIQEKNIKKINKKIKLKKKIIKVNHYKK